MNETLEIRAARFIDPEETRIDCEVNHPVYGWIPFTADPEDVEQYGRDVYAAAVAGEVAAYTPPPEPTPEERRAALPPLSRRQLLLCLAEVSIKGADVEAALAGDETGLIEWENASQFERLHPLIDQVGQQFDLPPEQIDSLWAFAANL